ncbi:hypothetical protein JCM21900_002309 [Sporobolomyces salmonicolor]
MAAPPPSASRLSHLCTTLLTSVLELQRLHQLNLPTSASLSSTISRNLAQLTRGIDALEEAGTESHDVMAGLQGQEQRLLGLVEGLGVHVEESVRRGKGKGKTGRLVETDDEGAAEDDLFDGDGAVPLEAVKPPHIAISMPTEDDTERDLHLMEEDEETMRRANGEVLQMQKRMLEDQDEQLDSLSSAISRQHALSLRVAEELELHSSLLDDTDSALGRTESNLRQASGRLDTFARRAKDTGSTGLIVFLIIVLVILILVFKA